MMDGMQPVDCALDAQTPATRGVAARYLAALVPVPGLVLAATLALTGCAADAPRANVVAERDSAGIRIVENAEPRPGAVAEWMVDGEPSVEIGVLEGDPARQFFRVASTLRLSDGRIVVADGGSGELRVFDAVGRHLATGGRKGDGPGEFRNLSRVYRLSGDTILAWDIGLRRISYFDADARFLRSIPLDGAGGGSMNLVDVLDDGTVLASVSPPLPSGSVLTDGLRGDSALHVRVDPRSARIDTVGWLPTTQSMIRTTSSGGQVVGIQVWRLPFLRNAFIGTAGEHVFAATNDRYEIALRDADGQLTRILRRAVRREPFTEDYAREHFLGQRDPNDVDPAELREVYPGVPRPDHLPVLRAIRVDATGHIWVERFRWPNDDQPVWDVFDPEGRLAAVVRTPPGLRVDEIGADYVVGVWRDELEVERVRVYGFSGPGPKV